MKRLLVAFSLLFATNVYAGDKFCHLTYEMITNADVPVNAGVVDQAANNPGADAIFFYEVSYSSYEDGKWTRKTLSQLDCEDSSADKEVFKKSMLDNCESVNMGGISVPMTEAFDFTKACG